MPNFTRPNKIDISACEDHEEGFMEEENKLLKLLGSDNGRNPTQMSAREFNDSLFEDDTPCRNIKDFSTLQKDSKTDNDNFILPSDENFWGEFEFKRL